MRGLLGLAALVIIIAGISYIEIVSLGNNWFGSAAIPADQDLDRPREFDTLAPHDEIDRALALDAALPAIEFLRGDVDGEAVGAIAAAAARARARADEVGAGTPQPADEGLYRHVPGALYVGDVDHGGALVSCQTASTVHL
jgi:hypothetical protein